ncbi:MAG TPA: DUF2147 domain-containing protein [Pseudolabrys sp.]|nr:DUF2147 domain-containing protein [Pseudolabrys sp.]
MPVGSWPAAAMPSSLRLVATLACAALLTSATSATAQPGVAGTWRVEDGKAVIRIVDCGGKYWGVVAWEHSPGRDSKNPNPALKSRPTLGMPVLLGMTPDRADQWSGHIYNAEDGQTYESHIKLSGDTLRVEGCVLGFMCGGETWRRAAPAVAENTHRGPAHATTGSGRAHGSIAEEPAARICSRIGGR